MICPNCEHVFEVPEIILPDWYEILFELATRKGLPGLPPYEFANHWVGDKLESLSYAEIEDVANSVKSKWGGKGWKNNDLWATFQTWGRLQVGRNGKTKSKYY